MSSEDESEVLSDQEEVVEFSDDASFADLGLCEELCESVAAVGWTTPTGIQRATLPYALKGRDLIGLAETGSGKTGAFALPILQRLIENPQRLFAVVLAPTRELCVQISEQFGALGALIHVETCTIVGGLDMVTQAMELAKKPHIIVASPGRLIDHLENTKGFNLKSIKFLVMDEADRLLSMDFEDALNRLVQILPRRRTTYLFSATMTKRVSKLKKASLRNPANISLSNKYDTVKNLVQTWQLVPHAQKWAFAAAFAKYYANQTMIAFCNSCKGAHLLACFFRQYGLLSVTLHGQMTQAQRLGALTTFKAKERKILVATEVGSRGLDIPNVDIVLNFDVPTGSKDYVHRVGRTARAGKSGKALTVVTQYDVEPFQKIEAALGHQLPQADDVTRDMWTKEMEQANNFYRQAAEEVKQFEGVGKKRFRSSGGKSAMKKRR
ncbi:MAG: hypothetical protein KVP17_002443 [Porospora cf. gigantea B]|uniref:uncharacterized protein n=1 Tax=Porospora cf. gigantea B TaxID=2853592 RepID=UPI003571BE9B|nr:MAG: hypothetical protein KVP17_002443 [Porospora cf. gigantea B]